MANCLVTGGAGFIGSHLCDSLINKGYNVTAVDNLSKGKIENLSSIIDHKNFSFKKIDIMDYEILNRSIKNAVDIIFHLAAHKIPRYSNSLNTLTVNSQGTKNVLDIAKKFRSKFVLASTSDVYGKNTKIPFSEESELVLGSSTVKRWSYSVSKIFDEHLALAYADEFEFPVTILRFFSTYGPRNHKDWWGGPQSVFIEAILNGRDVEIHGDGNQTRSFCYIDDLINGIVSVLGNDRANNEIINLGNDNEIKIIDLALKINSLIDKTKKIKTKYIPYESFTGKKYEDVLRRVPDITKAKEILNFNVRVGLDEGLKRTIEWHKANRH